MISSALFGSGEHRQSSVSMLLLRATLIASAVSANPVFSRQNRYNQTSYLPYKNANLTVELRLDDLISRMTIEEKAGQMFHQRTQIGINGALNEDDEESGIRSIAYLMHDLSMTHFNVAGAFSNATLVAEWANRVQQSALDTRLGIPVTFSSDQRHLYAEPTESGALTNVMSQWPEALGIAALRDPAVALQFAQIAAQEYRAVGLRAALHPQIDLATEPRWGRMSGTFGEDANLTSSLVVSYIKGFQGETFGPNSVTTVTKHFPGAGTVKEGHISHFPAGSDAVYPGDNFDYHLGPFKAAIAAGARQMMPYYTRPVGTKYEEVGAGFNYGIVTELLREELGFNDGIVLSDWGLISDFTAEGELVKAISWGAENLTQGEKVVKVLNAGTDQFGGEHRPELLAELVHNGTIPESRLDISVRRILREKFLLGLFDNPFVTVADAASIVGTPQSLKAGEEAQRASHTLLTNKNSTLPLRKQAIGPTTKIYIEGFNARYLEPFNVAVVDTVAEADFAILRLDAPFQRFGGGFEQLWKQGSLAFSDAEIARHQAIFDAVPTIVSIYLHRPAVIPEIAAGAAALLGHYGSGPAAMLDVIFGTAENGQGIGEGPKGKLPFELPSSMEAVAKQKEDVPFDSENPTFEFGYGIVGYGNDSDE